MKKKRILFVAQNLHVGGVQTSLIQLLHVLAEQPVYEIDLFTFGRGPLLNKIPANVNIMYGNKFLKLAATPFSIVLHSKNPISILIRVLLMLYVRAVGSEPFYRSLFRKCKMNGVYDTAVSYFNDVPHNYFNQGTNLYVAEFVNAKEKWAWIHTDPILSGFDRAYCRHIYKGFQKIICVSKAVKEKMDLLLPEYADKTEVIYNRFDAAEIQKLAEAYPVETAHHKLNIVTVARVDNASKRMDEIVKICAALKSENIRAFCWRIVGDGPDLKKNRKLAKQLHVEDCIVFTGRKINPYPFIKNADLFALYSAYEGYPMVIGEAVCLHIPVLTKEYGAVFEQLQPSQGYVAETDKDFYTKIKQYIKEKQDKVLKGGIA